MIYLDNGATSFIKPASVTRAVVYALEHYASPGRGGYRASMEAANAVFDCRELAASLFEADAERVVFTMNATHALNIAIKSLVKAGERVVISGFEHNAVTRPLYAIGANVVVAGRKLFDEGDTLREFDNAITHGTSAVVCTHVSNVFGYRLPIEGIARLCAKRNVPLIVDASQSAGVLPVSMKQLGAAFIAMPGHKNLLGPSGSGILLCGQTPKPLIEGGTGGESRRYEMPDYLPDLAEAGTINVPGICGLAEGLRFVLQKGTNAILKKEQGLIAQMKAEMDKMPHISYYGGDESAQTGVLSFNVRSMDCEDVARILGERGIAVRAGIHCAALAHQSAGTIESGTVRISVSSFNTAEEIVRTARTMRTLEN